MTHIVVQCITFDFPCKDVAAKWRKTIPKQKKKKIAEVGVNFKDSPSLLRHYYSYEMNFSRIRALE